MTDVKATVATSQASKNDGANHISPSEFKKIKDEYKSAQQSPETMKWLDKENGPLALALSKDLDYSGYTGVAMNEIHDDGSGRLGKDVAARDARTNNQPSNSQYDGDSGLPKALGNGDPIGHKGQQRNFDVPTEGGKHNVIKVSNPITITDAEADTSKAAQRDYTAKMSGVLGKDVPTPPTAADEKAYLQGLAKGGASPDRIKEEHGEFLKTFYRHPGGVDWNPPLKSDEVDKRFADMPVAKDGKRVIDCEGYAALTENVLGDLKNKDGSKMFDVKCASSDQHVVATVVPHGGDPRKGFIVDNDSIVPFKNNASAADYNKSSPAARERNLIRDTMQHPDNIKHMGTPKEFGPFNSLSNVSTAD